MRKASKYIFIYVIIAIVIYVNFYVSKDPVWQFIYYSKDYAIYLLVGILMWKHKSIVLRSLIVGFWAYYLFEITMDVIKIIDIELHRTLYLKKYINYTIAIVVGLSLLILPTVKKIKK